MTPENPTKATSAATPSTSDPTARARARLREKSTTNITAQFHEEYFRTRFVYDPRRDGIWREVVKYIQKLYIAESDRVLDLGAGYCDFINHVVAAERHAVDIFTKLSKYAREGVQVHNHTCTDLSEFAAHSMDVIFASNLFEHLTHAELLETLDEIRRVLRPKGRLILLQPNFKYCYRTYFDDYTHLQIFTHMGMYDLLEMAGLRVERMHAKFLPVNMKSTLRLRIPCLPLVVRAYLHSPWKPRAGQMLAVATNENPTYVEP
jgi:ubiquinone/menaquinone biosynthesis C-methylase UbiE